MAEVWSLSREKQERFVIVVGYAVANLCTVFENRVPRDWFTLEDIFESLDEHGLLDDPCADDPANLEPEQSKDEMFVNVVADALGTMFLPHMRRWLMYVEKRGSMGALQVACDMEGLLDTESPFRDSNAGVWRQARKDRAAALAAKLFEPPSMAATPNKEHPHLKLVDTTGSSESPPA